MNRNIAAALLRDAFAQVVDNLVFRIMMILLLLLVLPAFLIAVEDDRFVVLFFIEMPYEDFLRMLGGSGQVASDAKYQIIDGLQGMFTERFERNPLAPMARATILMLCVFATAFFMPRMLEKGAADTIFSKPVSRLVLMLSRYVAGLIFVGVLVVCAVGGVHLGLLARSGYSSPDWLLLIPELIYCFAVFHAISVLVGVTTRSSVAAILLSAMFFVGNGTTHWLWRVMRAGEAPYDAASEVEEEEDAQEEEEERDLGDAVLGAFERVLDGLHLVLPKTADARLLSRLMRPEPDGPALEVHDDASGLRVAEAPAGFEREPRSSLAKEGVLWIARDASGGEARLRLSRSARSDGESRVVRARNLEESVRTNPNAAEVESSRAMLADRRADVVTWVESRGSNERRRRVALFQGGEWIFTLDYDGDAGWSARPEVEEALREFEDGMSFPDFDPMDQPSEYERRFGWEAPLAYNALYSLLSTLAFVVAVLAFGWWRLSRVDF